MPAGSHPEWIRESWGFHDHLPRKASRVDPPQVILPQEVLLRRSSQAAPNRSPGRAAFAPVSWEPRQAPAIPFCPGGSPGLLLGRCTQPQPSLSRCLGPAPHTKHTFREGGFFSFFKKVTCK